MCKRSSNENFADALTFMNGTLDHICALQATRIHVGQGQHAAHAHQHTSFDGMITKRVPARASGEQSPPAKRCRRQDAASAAAGGRHSPPTAKDALQRLRVVMQSMDAPQRRAAILSLAPPVRAALLAFMEGPQRDTPRPRPTTMLCSRVRALQGAAVNSGTCGRALQVGAALSGIRTVRLASGVRYHAQVHVKALRLYTPKQSTPEAAAAHQALLARIREALLAASADAPLFWLDHERVARVCSRALRECGAAERELGLRALVHLRAARWLGQGVQIASPALPLAEAAGLHAWLLRARAASWEDFRAEWLRLVRLGGRGGRRRLSASEAEARVDGARRSALQRQLVQAARGALRALERAPRGAQAVGRDLGRAIENGRARGGG
mmetsp:Transcript_20199/g.41872  ORF Transcript_20199/g.41872 Transcript_20199/m.41872 type:complete len:384 (-) Transcript_20199:155-1306(-)